MTIVEAGYAVVMGYPITETPVVIDAMPDDCPNRLPAPVTGWLDVVLRGRSDLDAATIDSSTIRLNGIAPASIEADPADRAVAKRSPNCDDCGPPATDGFPDLIARFDLARVAPTLAPNAAGLAALDLTARLLSGRRIHGADCIRLPVARLVAAPNPARRGMGVTLTFTIPAGGTAPRVRVYDLRGRRVRDIPVGNPSAGPASVTWNERDANATPVAGGLYVARAESAGRVLGTARVLIVP